jgi:hypothetical protein
METAVSTRFRTDHVFSATRWLAILVIPFLLSASAILLIWPGDTGRLFAWPIKPPMTAMMLGSAYMGGLYFFFRVLWARQWHTIKAGFLPVATFAGLMGIATVLHWDKFTPGHISFIAWASVYFVSPFLVLGAWWFNRATDPQAPDAKDQLIPRVLRLILGAAGVVEIGVGVLLFLVPALMISIWPWTLSPLTARAVGAMVTLPGVVQLGMALDPRWSSARVVMEAQAFSLVFILISAVRSWNDFNLANVGTYLFTGGLGALLVYLVGLYLWMEFRPKAARG